LTDSEIRQVRMPVKHAEQYFRAVDWFINEDVDLFGARHGRTLLTMLTMHAATLTELDPGKLRLTMKSSISGAKLLAARDVLTTATRPTVVFTMSGQLVDLIRHFMRQKEYRNSSFTILQPDHQPVPRQTKALKSFNSGEALCLVASSKIGVGVDLSRAEEAVFLQRSWSDLENQWVESKLRPDCKIVTYVSEGTLEVHQHLGFDRLSRIVGKTKRDRRRFLTGKPLQESEG
jgi:hypothetical protein